MASRSITRTCNVVLHDDRVSTNEVLGGTEVLPVGSLAYLSTSETPAILILAEGTTNGSRDISIHVQLARRIGLVNRTQGRITPIKDASQVTASHVDIFLREQCLSRADMWYLTRQLDQRIVHKDSELHYLGHHVAAIQDIHRAGQSVSSALCQDGRSKSILRSGNARFMILIQISCEMLDDWIEEDLMHERLTSGFLLDLFERWEALKVRHLVSIVLFGRTNDTDFFSVLQLDAPCSQWRAILLDLKRTFNATGLPRGVSLASSGNVLEAITLAVSHYLAADESVFMAGTCSAIIVVTAGSGLFEADHGLLNTATRILLGNSIGVDIVSLAHKPSHPVPLFAYTLNGADEYALPHWADISFYKPQTGLQKVPPAEIPIACNSSSLHIPLLQPYAVNSDTFDHEAFSEAVTNGTKLIDGSPTKTQELDIPTKVQPLEDKHETPSSVYKHNETTKSSTIPPKLRQHPSTSSITTTISLNKEKRAGALSLLSNRKISVGPRGLAPVTGIASTTLSSAHANQDRDTAQRTQLAPVAVEGGIAKQIRASLRKRPSQSSMFSRVTTENEEVRTQAIDITAMQNTYNTSLNAVTDSTGASVDSQQSGSSPMTSQRSSSKTPRAFSNMAFSPQKLDVDPAVSALTPWLTLTNPCKLKRNNMRIASYYRQWQHVFLRAVDSADFKWTSVCAPAALPLYHDQCPSTEDLKRYYKRSTRRLVCGQHGSMAQRPHDLMQRLIAMRLAHGFQLITARGGREDSHVFMSIGADYHELHCLSDLELEVIEFTCAIPELAQQSSNIVRTLSVKAPYNDGAIPAAYHFASNTSQIDWSTLDREVESAESAIALSRMRLVLVPVDRESGENGMESSTDLAADEERIEGIQRLTQQWQRHRVLSDEHRNHHVSIARRRQLRIEDEIDPNPLAVEYHTRDPSALVNAQNDHLISHVETDAYRIPLFAEADMYHSSNFDMVKLVRQMQEAPPQGVEVRDRRWLARIHFKCFRGDEMTSWLLGAFKDLHTREDAVEMGNELMSRGVFNHVRHKHAFLDGNYFYQIAPAHRTVEYPNAMASVFNRGSTRSVPATPSSEVRKSPQVRPSRGDSESSGPDSAQILPTERKQVMLSQMLKYNVDPTGRSTFDEHVCLHYDRIHNPENCYHIYLDWCLTTPMLIQDAITRWASIVENYRLRLVQIPLLEAHKHSQQHPLEQPLLIKLAQAPPERIPATPLLSSISAGNSRLVEDRAYYHKAILRKLGFVLDMESADSFSDKLEVTVTWGKMDFGMTQFVHRSGLVLAQISKHRQWDFLLLPNTLATSQSHISSGRNQAIETVQSVLASVQDFAGDAQALRAVYDEAAKPRMAASSSPFARAVQTNADADVPPMQLPPHILHRVFS